MKDLIDSLERWRAEGRRAAVARVIDVEGSAPRGPGAAMAVADTGEIVGSVSGGCVEGSVLEAAQQALDSGTGSALEFGYSDDDAFAVGLTCGGTIRLFVEPFDWDAGVTADLAKALRSDEAFALGTVVSGPRTGAKVLQRANGPLIGTLGDPALDRTLTLDLPGELTTGATRIRHYGSRGETQGEDVEIFIESFVPPPRMIVFGAIDFSAALVRIAHVLGFRVTVCDARPAFATAARFPLAEAVVVDWPQRHLAALGDDLTARDAICVLTHDAKFDVPAIVAALKTDVGYIGVMGSRRTHRDRVERLRAEGVDAAGLSRLHSPIGLDIGARTPEETAIAICAELIADRTGREQILPLRASEGPIRGRTVGSS
jgi:xanthine dehydrogenase accessory factor